MNMGNLFGKIMGFLVIIITLALAPSIQTANATVLANTGVANSSLTGMLVIGGFGAPLIILGLLASGGIFALAGAKGQLGGATGRDLMAVVGSVIVAIVALTFMDSICTYTTTLVVAAVGTFGATLYAIIPLLVYLGIIAGVGWTQVSSYRRLKKGGKKTAVAAGY